MAEPCRYCGNWEGECQLWEEGSSINPEAADDKGYCSATDDEDPSWCQSYEGDGSEEGWENVCDYC
jgi:hypothetical protein